MKPALPVRERAQFPRHAVVIECQSCFEPPQPLGGVDSPASAVDDCQPESSSRISALNGKTNCGAKVVTLALAEVANFRPASGRQAHRRSSPRRARKCSRWSSLRANCFTSLNQPLRARTRRTVSSIRKRSPSTPTGGSCRRAIAACRGPASQTLLGRLERPATREDAEPPEERPLVVREQVVAPVHRRPQRALPLGSIAAATRQQRQDVRSSRSEQPVGRHETALGRPPARAASGRRVEPHRRSPARPSSAPRSPARTSRAAFRKSSTASRLGQRRHRELDAPPRGGRRTARHEGASAAG